MSEPSSRRLDLDAAKGLAIILVVAGHVVARDIKPVGNGWYEWANLRLYSFHMAFFFFLAGWVFFLRPITDWRTRWEHTAARLIPAYVLFASIVFVAKRMVSHFLPVDRPVGQAADELLLLLMYPTQGFASFLWFIVVVLQIHWVAPALLRVFQGREFVVLLLAALLHLAAVSEIVTEVFALNSLCRYLLFFVLGAFVVRQPQAFGRFAQHWPWLLLLLVVLLGAVSPAVLPTVAALVSLPALFGLAQAMHTSGHSRMLVFLGVNSFTIYLMNSLCMGLVRAVVLRTTGWDGVLFPFVAVLLLTCGLLLPILVQRLTFSHVPALDRITR